MHVEVSVALNFVISYLYNKLPRRRVDMFGEELEKGIKNKFEGHWYDDKPYKGSAYRCIRVSTEKVEPVMEIAASVSRLDIEEIKEYLPKDLTIWIDPGEVSYRIGEKGVCKVLYSSRTDNESYQGIDKEIATASKGFNPDAQSFRPIDSLSSSLSNLSVSPCTTSPTQALTTNGSTSPWGNGSVSPTGAGSSYGSVSPSGSSGSAGPNSASVASFLNRNQQKPVMTTAMFAQTKFGSTKLKTQAKRPSRLSPTELSAFIKQRPHPQALAAPIPGMHPFGVAPGGMVPNQSVNNRPRTLSPRSPVRAPPGAMPHPLGFMESHQGRLQQYLMMQQQAMAQNNPALHHQGALSPGMSPFYNSMSDLYGSFLGPLNPSASLSTADHLQHQNIPGYEDMPLMGTAGQNIHCENISSNAGPSSANLKQPFPSPEGSMSHKTLVETLNQNNIVNYPGLQHLLVAN